jgi:hypothetical protein
MNSVELNGQRIVVCRHRCSVCMYEEGALLEWWQEVCEHEWVPALTVLTTTHVADTRRTGY